MSSIEIENMRFLSLPEMQEIRVLTDGDKELMQQLRGAIRVQEAHLVVETDFAEIERRMAAYLELKSDRELRFRRDLFDEIFWEEIMKDGPKTKPPGRNRPGKTDDSRAKVKAARAQRRRQK